jgi:hypothetical protein
MYKIREIARRSVLVTIQQNFKLGIIRCSKFCATYQKTIIMNFNDYYKIKYHYH